MKISRYLFIVGLSFLVTSCSIFRGSGYSKKGKKSSKDRLQTDTLKAKKEKQHIFNTDQTIADFVMDYVDIKYKNLEKKISFNPMILISINKQLLYLIKDRKVIETYKISTSAHGVGNKVGSDKTPLGLHVIRRKIGSDVPLDGLFKSRIYTGRIAKIYTDTTHSKSDDITTRIMWLQGKEKGINRGRGIDSFKRDIYIHGTSEEGLLGTPTSHGCIRMSNKGVLELYKFVSVGTPVLIVKY